MPESRFITLLQLARAPAMFSALSNIIAAHLIATGGALRGSDLLWLCVATVLLYGAGMILNDCFDLQEDMRERPQRPLPSGRFDIAGAWSIGWLGLAGGVAAAAIVGPRAAAVAIVLAACILAYNAGLKYTALGAPAMAACRYLNWLMGLAVLPISPLELLLPMPVFLYVLGLTRLSQAETGAGDPGAVQSCMRSVGASVLVAAALILFGGNPWALPAVAAAAAAAWILLSRTARDFTPARIQQTMGLLIFGIVLVDALIVLGFGPWWGAAIIATLWIPGRLLGRWLYVT